MKQDAKVSRKWILSLLFLVVVVFISLIVSVVVISQTNTAEINSFQECADAGYPIQESYPERCAVPGGKTFTNV